MRDPSLYPTIALMAGLRVFDLPMDDIRRSREQPYVSARMIGMWLLKDVCGWSSQLIGRLTRRDHGTVLHAWQVVEDRIETEDAWRERVARARGLFLRAIRGS